MAVLDEILQNQIMHLQNDVKELSTKIEKILAGCAVRHRLDISSEIVRLETEIKNISKEFQTFETTINNNANAVEKNKEKLNELTGRVNILAIKIDDIEELHRKMKDNKSNFIMQISIIVISSLITAIITLFCTLAWTNLTRSTSSNSVQHSRTYNNNDTVRHQKINNK